MGGNTGGGRKKADNKVDGKANTKAQAEKELKQLQASNPTKYAGYTVANDSPGRGGAKRAPKASGTGDFEIRPPRPTEKLAPGWTYKWSDNDGGPRGRGGKRTEKAGKWVATPPPSAGGGGKGGLGGFLEDAWDDVSAVHDKVADATGATKVKEEAARFGDRVIDEAQNATEKVVDVAHDALADPIENVLEQTGNDELLAKAQPYIDKPMQDTKGIVALAASDASLLNNTTDSNSGVLNKDDRVQETTENADAINLIRQAGSAAASTGIPIVSWIGLAANAVANGRLAEADLQSEGDAFRNFAGTAAGAAAGGAGQSIGLEMGGSTGAAVTGGIRGGMEADSRDENVLRGIVAGAAGGYLGNEVANYIPDTGSGIIDGAINAGAKDAISQGISGESVDWNQTAVAAGMGGVAGGLVDQNNPNAAGQANAIQNVGMGIYQADKAENAAYAQQQANDARARRDYDAAKKKWEEDQRMLAKEQRNKSLRETRRAYGRDPSRWSQNDIRNYARGGTTGELALKKERFSDDGIINRMLGTSAEEDEA